MYTLFLQIRYRVLVVGLLVICSSLNEHLYEMASGTTGEEN